MAQVSSGVPVLLPQTSTSLWEEAAAGDAEALLLHAGSRAAATGSSPWVPLFAHRKGQAGPEAHQKVQGS